MRDDAERRLIETKGMEKNKETKKRKTSFDENID